MLRGPRSVSTIRICENTPAYTLPDSRYTATLLCALTPHANSIARMCAKMDATYSTSAGRLRVYRQSEQQKRCTLAPGRPTTRLRKNVPHEYGKSPRMCCASAKRPMRNGSERQTTHESHTAYTTRGPAGKSDLAAEVAVAPSGSGGGGAGGRPTASNTLCVLWNPAKIWSDRDARLRSTTSNTRDMPRAAGAGLYIRCLRGGAPVWAALWRARGVCAG